MRFSLDENLSHQIARIARLLGVDVASSHETGRNSLPDEDQLRLAAEEGRCLVTRDGPDFIHLTERFFEEQSPHAGVLILSSRAPTHDFARIARALAEYAEQHPDGLPPYTVTYLPVPPIS